MDEEHFTTDGADQHTDPHRDPQSPTPTRQPRKLPLALIETYDSRNTLKRPIQQNAVAGLAESMAKIGLLTPIVVRSAKIIRGSTEVDGWKIIYGHHRKEAAYRLGWTHIPCIIFEDGELDSKAATISENLHRADLTTEELQHYRKEWAESIMGRKASDVQVLAHDGPKPRNRGAGQGVGGGRPKGGMRAAAREMGVPRTTVQRAVNASAPPNTTDGAKLKPPQNKRQQRSANRRERETASSVERQSRLVPLAERVIEVLGDDLLRQALAALDDARDRSAFIEMLRRGLKPGGAE